jgi:hypothetical protein
VIGKLTIKIAVRPDGDEWVLSAYHQRPDGLWDSRSVEASGGDAFERVVARVPAELQALIDEARLRDEYGPSDRQAE